jgi:hypothetical protein
MFDIYDALNSYELKAMDIQIGDVLCGARRGEVIAINVTLPLGKYDITYMTPEGDELCLECFETDLFRVVWRQSLVEFNTPPGDSSTVYNGPAMNKHPCKVVDTRERCSQCDNLVRD